MSRDILVVAIRAGGVTGICGLEVRDPGNSTEHSSLNRAVPPLSLLQELSDPKIPIILRMRIPDLAQIALTLLGKNHHLGISINFAFYKTICSNLL